MTCHAWTSYVDAITSRQGRPAFPTPVSCMARCMTARAARVASWRVPSKEKKLAFPSCSLASCCTLNSGGFSFPFNSLLPSLSTTTTNPVNYFHLLSLSVCCISWHEELNLHTYSISCYYSSLFHTSVTTSNPVNNFHLLSFSSTCLTRGILNLTCF